LRNAFPEGGWGGFLFWTDRRERGRRGGRFHGRGRGEREKRDQKRGKKRRRRGSPPTPCAALKKSEAEKKGNEGEERIHLCLVRKKGMFREIRGEKSFLLSAGPDQAREKKNKKRKKKGIELLKGGETETM